MFRKLIKFSCLLIAISLFPSTATADPTVWTGPKIVFTKADWADWTQEANQDRITDNVWITRADSRPLFNARTEGEFQGRFSPEDTEWAVGSTVDYATLEFTDLHRLVWSVWGPPDFIGVDLVLHLITDDIYIDFRILAWTEGIPPEEEGESGTPNGGGFSFERSTAAVDPCDVVGLGDVNCDGVLNVDDYRAIRPLLGLYGDDPGWVDNADLNGDGKIWYDDLRLLIRLVRGR